jgi:hypothetical protein
MANKQKIVLLLDGDAKGAIKATQLTGKGLDSVTSKGKRAAGQFGAVAKKGAKWGAVAGGAAAAGVAVLIKQQLDLIDNTAKTADKLGIATEKLTAMRVQAELTGVAQGTLDKGLQQMIKGVADAAEGTGLAADSLAKLNLNAEQLKNLSPDQQFYAIADAMEEVKNNTDKVSIAYDLFGAKGTSLINTLKGGSAAALEAQKFTDQWGLAINRVDSSKIEQANDAMTLLGEASQGFWRQLTVNVSPAITGMAKEMLGMGEGFGTAGELADKAFKAIITGAGFVGDMGRGLQIIWKGATLVVAEWFARVWEAVAGADRLITGLLNKLPEAMGGGSFETSDFLQNVSGALRNTADDISNELSELVNGALPSDLLKDKIKKWEEAATAAGQKVADSAKVVAGDYEAAAGAAEQLTAAEKKRSDEAEKLAAAKADLLGGAEYEVGLLSRELTATSAGTDALAAFNREKTIEAALRSESVQTLLPAELEKYTAMVGVQYDLALAITEKAAADKAAAEAAKESAGAMDKFLNASFGEGLAEGFNQGSKALSTFIDGFGELLDVQAQYNAAQLDAAATDADKANASAKYQSAQVSLYGDMAASSKQFFDEGSKGYKALQAAEQTFRAFEIAMAGKVLFAKLFSTSAATAATVASVPIVVAAEGTKAAAAGAAAAASSMVGSPFPLNMAALAATLAALAAIGVMVGGGGGAGGISGAQAAQESQGTGTVLGDPNAKSESAFKALELMEEHLSEGLKVSSGMLNELRTLNSNISGLGNLLGRQLDFEGGLVSADLSGGLGGAGSAYMDMIDRTTLGFGDEIDKLLGGFYSNIASTISSSRSWKNNEGLKIAGGAVADILESGAVQAMAWAVVNTKSSKLFSGTETNSRIVSRDLGEEISGQFGQVIAGIYSAVFSAVGGMGVGDISGITEFAGFKVSTMGLTSEDAQAEISAVLSEFADTIALEALPALINMQNVGEGAFETLARVSTQTLIFKDAAESLGLSLSSQASKVEQSVGRIGLAIMGGVSGLFGRGRRGQPDQSDANFRRKWSDEQILIIADTLVTAAGGIEQFASNVASFTDMVLTDAEKFARNEGYVASMFERLGEVVPASIKDLGAYVSGLDLSSAAHQRAFTTLTGASDLLDDYYSKLEDYSKTAYNFDTALGLNDGRKGLREALAAVGQNFDVVQTAALGGVSALAELFGGLTDVEKAGLEPFTDSILNLIPASADASNGLADMQSQMERLGGIAKSIRQYLDGLNSSGINGTPEQQVQAAFAELQSLSAAAYGGDADAAQRLTSVADQVLRLGDTAYASGEQFQTLFSSVKTMLATVADNTDFQTVEDMQLGLMRNQLDSLDGIIAGITNLGGSLTVEMAATATSEIEKLITFVTDTDGFPADLQSLALSTASNMLKTVDFLAGSELSSELKVLALTEQSDLIKTVNALLAGGYNQQALDLALASNSTIQKAITASGGKLTADQIAILNALNGTANVSLSGDVLLEADDEIRKGLFWWNSKNLVTSSLGSMVGILSDIAAYSRQSAYTGLETFLKQFYNDGYGDVFASPQGIKDRASNISDRAYDAGFGLERLFPNLQNATGSLYEATSVIQGIADLYDKLNVTPSAKGNAFNSGDVTAFAAGGAFTNSIINDATMAPMALFGEAGPEAIMPLHRGPNGSLGVRGNSVDMAPVVNAIDGHRLETQHQTKIQAASQKQSIEQLRALNVRVSSLEVEIKTARLVNS